MYHERCGVCPPPLPAALRVRENVPDPEHFLEWPDSRLRITGVSREARRARSAAPAHNGPQTRTSGPDAARIAACWRALHHTPPSLQHTPAGSTPTPERDARLYRDNLLKVASHKGARCTPEDGRTPATTTPLRAPSASPPKSLACTSGTLATPRRLGVPAEFPPS